MKKQLKKFQKFCEMYNLDKSLIHQDDVTGLIMYDGDIDLSNVMSSKLPKAFKYLYHIKGNFNLKNYMSLRDFEYLKNLRYVDGDFDVSYTGISNFKDFKSLERVGGYINAQDTLFNRPDFFEGLENVTISATNRRTEIYPKKVNGIFWKWKKSIMVSNDSEFEDMFEDIMDNFDFEKVHKVMKFLKWSWASCNGIPTIEYIKENCRVYLKEAYDKKVYIESGGFLYSYDEGVLGLKFVLESWDSN